MTDESNREIEPWVELLGSLNGGRICLTCTHAFEGEEILDCQCRKDPPAVVPDGEGGGQSVYPEVPHDSCCESYDAIDLRAAREVGLALLEYLDGEGDGEGEAEGDDEGGADPCDDPDTITCDGDVCPLPGFSAPRKEGDRG